MKTSATIRYIGPALDAGKMDVYQASENMIAFSEFMVAAVKATYGEQAEAKAQVEGFTHGSFVTNILFEVGGAAATMFSSYTSDQLWTVVKGAFGLWKHLKNGKPSSISYSGNIANVTNNNGEIIQINIASLNLVINNDKSGDAVQRFVQKPLNLEGYDSLEITSKDSGSMITEDAIQGLLFEVETIPFPTPKDYCFKFIDLFAGIGGFRIALQNLGGKCVFTSEWDINAQKTYRKNFGELPFGDITKSEIKEYIPPEFDVLCAGFPCQPFSKGGHRTGFEDARGTLFFDICEIVNKHKPKFLFLENVSNLVSHDNGNTYHVILNSLDKLGYCYPTKPLIISPDKFGVPVLRPRVYIPCVRKDIASSDVDFIKNFNLYLEKEYSKSIDSIDKILDLNQKNDLTDYEKKVLKMWDDFYQGIDLKIIGFPIWSEYFKYDGNFSEYPVWKVKFIEKNVALYQRNKSFIDYWFKKYDDLDWCVKTHKKMEWQAGDKYKSLYECLIQFRPSGIRVKKPDKFSTLVAMNHQQIIGKLKRKVTINESKLLQSFPTNYILSESNAIAMKQLGNSVNVNVIEKIFSLIKDRYD